jgi:hypothetical protein
MHFTRLGFTNLKGKSYQVDFAGAMLLGYTLKAVNGYFDPLLAKVLETLLERSYDDPPSC